MFRDKLAGSAREDDRAAAGGCGRMLTAELKATTQELHVKAERTGVIADLLRGQADLSAYCLYLRNLVPVYCALEHELARHGDEPYFAGVRFSLLSRSALLESDLLRIHGADWFKDLSVTEACDAYAGRIEDAGKGDGVRLLGHAYVRYMGDLSGGQILRRLLSRSLDLPPEALRFYGFPEIPNIEAFKDSYRQTLDALKLSTSEVAQIVEEACEAFRLNIALSVAVQRPSLDSVV